MTASPSWNLSRYVRSTIICNDLPVNATTATAERIETIAGNLTARNRYAIAGYDAAVVREILLDQAVTAPYRADDAPEKYAGR